MSKDLWARLWVIVAVAMLAMVPFFTQSFTRKLITEVFIFAIVAMSLDLLLGYTGLVSLGHAAVFGMGAYAAGIVAHRWTTLFWVVVPIAILAAAAFAWIVGYFSLRTSAVTFLMLTLAFGEMLHALAIKLSKLTGGSDGLASIPRPTGLGFDVTSKNFYWIALASAVLVFWLIRRIVHSPFGKTLVGIRENENRIRALGLHTGRYKLAAFVVGGAIAGFAGSLSAMFNGFVGPETASWLASGRLLVMLIIGGSGTAMGPVLGAAVIIALQEQISSYTHRWPTFMGLLFLLFVFGARGGLVGIWNRLRKSLTPAAQGRRAA